VALGHGVEQFPHGFYTSMIALRLRVELELGFHRP
jgi:hypothetical protein